MPTTPSLRIPPIWSSRRSARRVLGAAAGALLLGLSLASPPAAGAQAPGVPAQQPAAPAGRGRILLLLPFENRSGQPGLDWIREAAPQVLFSRLSSAGFAPMSREDRLFALKHLGLPEGFQPSRASALKLAENLDADVIIAGSYLTDGAGILAEARIIDVSGLRMSEPVSARGPASDPASVFGSLAWRLARELEPGFNGSEAAFVAAGKGVSPDAFEQYCRGMTEPDRGERLRRLGRAVALSPGMGAAWMALGREQFAAQQYDEAAAAFARVGRDDPSALEARFYGGLSQLFSGHYPEAEQAFGEVAKVLPLGEVLNNQAVAVSRQGRDASLLFVGAETADPRAPDYHFNLAVCLRRRGAGPEALNELEQYLKMRPADPEAVDLERAWKTPAVSAPAAGDPARPEPLERIVRTFDVQAFRQAALMMDRMEAARLASLTPHQRALSLAGLARGYLDRGLLLEAERLFQSAVAADGSVAEAHSGLADVREQSGDADGARREARAAIGLRPSPEAYLVLARLDLGENSLNDASREAGDALRLDPSNRAAQDLNRQIALRAGRSR